MRHLGRHLILAACLFAAPAIASAAPSHRGKLTKKQAKHAQPADDQPDADDGDDMASRRDGGRVAHESWHRATRASRGRGTSAEDLFGDDDERPARREDRDDGRIALKKTARRHADVETPSGDEDEEVLPDRKKAAKRHRAVETLPADDDQVLPHHKKHRASVETLPSDDDAEVPAEASHHKATRHARATAGAQRKAARPATDDDSEGDGEAEDTARALAASPPALTGTAKDDPKPERVAFADPDQPAHAVDADTIQLDNAVHVHPRVASQAKDWRIAFGPYLWASAVDANVSLGPTTVSSGVDFVQLEQHARYGMEFLSEAHYKQLGVYGDLMYGVVAVDGSRNVGPLMVSLNGEASSILIDAAAGYTFYGDEHSLLSLEGRAGVRYQRTGVSAQLGLSGATVTPPEQISAGADALAGGHVVVRPRGWLFFTGTADVGVVGASSRTWSASADANLQLGPRLLLSVGYRTLTMDRAQVELVLHGPRAAFQLTF